MSNPFTGDPALDYTKPEQHSRAEESNHTVYHYKPAEKFPSLAMQLEPNETMTVMSGGITFRPDGSFEFTRPVKEVLKILKNIEDPLCKGLAALITEVYEAGLAGREIPMKGGSNG